MIQNVIPVRSGYLGFLRDANFDGIYYLYISQSTYHGLDQSFFPFFPLVINFVSVVSSISHLSAGILVVALSLCAALYAFAKLIRIDKKNGNYIWALIFFLAFPTSFFFGVLYTEGLFLCLTFLSFYFIRRKYFLVGSLFAMMATATRIVGIFLLPALLLDVYLEQRKEKRRDLKAYVPLTVIPIGLISYMIYLWYKFNDPLLFVHIQPAFGAGRSGGQIVLLPQVLYRYVKILISVPQTSLTFWISCLELATLFLGCFLLYLSFRKGIRKSYILFSFCVLLFPTLSGTLSSIPRYALASFAIFIYLGMIRSKLLKIILILLGFLLESLLAILFLQGYFVS